MFAYHGDRIGISGQQTMTVRPTPTPVYSDQEKHAFWLAAITSKPPRVRFSSEIRESLTDKEESLNHGAFIMFSLENPPLIPFEKYDFGWQLHFSNEGAARNTPTATSPIFPDPMPGTIWS
jgi:hypothetical protein